MNLSVCAFVFPTALLCVWFDANKSVLLDLEILVLVWVKLSNGFKKGFEFPIECWNIKGNLTLLKMGQRHKKKKEKRVINPFGSSQMFLFRKSNGPFNTECKRMFFRA